MLRDDSQDQVPEPSSDRPPSAMGMMAATEAMLMTLACSAMRESAAASCICAQRTLTNVRLAHLQQRQQAAALSAHLLHHTGHARTHATVR